MSKIRNTFLALTAAAAVSVTACAAPDDSPAGGARETATASQGADQAAGAATVEPAADETYEAPSREEMAERAFLLAVTDYQSPSDEASLMVGRATCSLLDEGSTPETLAYEVLTATGPVVPGFLNDELPYIYGAAMGSLCPEHGERFFG